MDIITFIKILSIVGFIWMSSVAVFMIGDMFTKKLGKALLTIKHSKDLNERLSAYKSDLLANFKESTHIPIVFKNAKSIRYVSLK